MQQSIFDLMYEIYKIENKIRLIELFGGYGSQAASLNFLGANFEHHCVCEFDEAAITTYNAFHSTNFKTSDITQLKATDLNIVDRDKYTYIMTYSFPCQDLSNSGKKQGMEKGSGTRSGLLWEVERLLIELGDALPQVLIMENVPPVAKAQGWEEWNNFLNKLGYTNHCEILNAKDYAIPQNRERCFMVSILGDYNYHFPQKMKLEYIIKDFLEKEVDEKYYLKKVLNEKCTENYIQYDNSGKGYASQAARAYYLDSLCPALPSNNNGDKSQIVEAEKKVVAAVLRERNNKQEYEKSLFTENQAKMITIDGDVKRYVYSDKIDKFKEGQIADISFPNGYNKGSRVFDECPTINVTTTQSSFITKESQKPLRIRKLTAKECYRFMGIPDNMSCKTTVSNSQKYKQAGNSIVTTCLMGIFGELLGIDYQSKIKQLVEELTHYETK